MAGFDHIIGTVKRLSNDGVVVVVDRRQRAHAFDLDDIQGFSSSNPVAIGETVTISSDGMNTWVKLG